MYSAVPRVFGSFLGRAPVALGQGVLGSSSSFKGQGFNGTLQSVKDRVHAQAFSTVSQEEDKAASNKAVAGIKLPGMAGGMPLSTSRSGLHSAMVPFAAQQSMNMSTGEVKVPEARQDDLNWLHGLVKRPAGIIASAWFMSKDLCHLDASDLEAVLLNRDTRVATITAFTNSGVSEPVIQALIAMIERNKLRAAAGGDPRSLGAGGGGSMDDGNAYDWVLRLNNIGLTAEEVAKAHIVLRDQPANTRKVYLADPPGAAAAAVRALLKHGAAAARVAGGSVAAAAVPRLPPPRLSDVAYTLQQLDSGSSSTSSSVKLYKLVAPGSCPSDIHRDIFPRYFVDSSDVVGQVDSWLVTVRNNFDPSPIYSTAEVGIVPLFIHGFIKSGKSLVLGHLLPSLLQRHPCFGVGGPAEMLLCPLDFQAITWHGTASYKDRLSSLLGYLRMWAGTAAPASNIGLYEDAWRLEKGISEFFWNLGRPVLYTVDELQAWFLLPDSDSDNLDKARYFIKRMLRYMPCNAAVAMTGSSMCQLLVTEEGHIRPAMTYHSRLPPIMLLEARKKLLCFGNTTVKAWDKDFKEDPALPKFFQALANSGRLSDDVFEAVARNPYNRTIAAKRRTCGEDWSTMPPWKKVALYHWLLRNALAHDEEYRVQKCEMQDDMPMEGMDVAEVLALVQAYPFADLNQIPELLRGARTMSSGGGLSGAELDMVAKGNQSQLGHSGVGGGVPQALPARHSSGVLSRTSLPSMPSGGRQMHTRHCVQRNIPGAAAALAASTPDPAALGLPPPLAAALPRGAAAAAAARRAPARA